MAGEFSTVMAGVRDGWGQAVNREKPREGGWGWGQAVIVNAQDSRFTA